MQPIRGVSETVGSRCLRIPSLHALHRRDVQNHRREGMKMRISRSISFAGAVLALAFFMSPMARAQQTLGGITGTVTDASGAVITGATVTLVGDDTKLSRTQTTS